MYPLVDQLTLPSPPTRKYRPLPPRPLPQHSRDHAIHHSHTSSMSYTDSALRSAVVAPKHNDTVHTPSRSENSWDHTPSPNGSIISSYTSESR